MSKIRYLLLGQVMPYLFTLWRTNIVGPAIGYARSQETKEVIPNTPHSVQEARVLGEGKANSTNVFWDLLLLRILLNGRPGRKQLYKVCPRMAAIEGPEFEADMGVDGDVPVEREYEEHLKRGADEPWLHTSTRSQRIMHGMCSLELKLCKVTRSRRYEQAYKVV